MDVKSANILALIRFNLLLSIYLNRKETKYELEGFVKKKSESERSEFTEIKGYGQMNLTVRLNLKDL